MLQIWVHGSGGNVAAARRQSGFTLLELIVVLAVLVSVSALFPLALDRAIPARRLDAAAHSLADRLRTWQSRAAAGGSVLRVTASASTYSLHEPGRIEEVPLPADIRLSLLSPSTSQPQTDLQLLPDGSSNGGRFELHAEHGDRFVRVSPLTGRVRVE
jgi:general secretion pathway protein H